MSGKITTWYHQSFPIMPMNDSVSSSRYPSHSQAGLHVLSKPFTFYRVSFSQAVPGRDYEYTSTEAPFFLTRWEAERHLLYDIAEDAVSSPAQTPDAGVHIYIEHLVLQRDLCGAWPEHRGWRSVTPPRELWVSARRESRDASRALSMTGAKSRCNTRRCLLTSACEEGRAPDQHAGSVGSGVRYRG
jgi:hypothetical protein